MFLKLFIFTCTEPASEPDTKELFSNHSTPPLPLAPSLNADCVVSFIPSYLFQYFSPSRLDKLTLLERAVLWKCWEFPLDWDCSELRHCCHVRVCTCIRVWEGRREGEMCLHARGLPGGFMQHAGCRHPHLWLLHRRPVLWHVVHGGRSIWPYLHHPLLWNLITDIQLQSHHSLAVNIHWGSLRA